MGNSCATRSRALALVSLLLDLSHSMRAPQLYPPDVSLAIASRSHGGLGGRPGADGLGIGKFGSKKVLVAFSPMPLPAGVTSYVHDGGFGGGEGGGCDGGAQKPSQSIMYSTYT